MGIEYRVALSGFSPFERAALASYFRLVATRVSHHYIQSDDIAQAEFIVVDADQPELVVAVLSAARVADTVFVGAHAPPTAMAQLQRPIDPRHVVLELDAFVAQRSVQAPAPAPVPEAAQAASAAPAPPPPSPHPAEPASAGAPQLLLVGSARAAQQRLTQRLQALGVLVLAASHADQALEQLEQHDCSAVFIDATPQDDADAAGGDLDGLVLCQDIKRSHRRRSARELPVVLVASRGSAADRVRGSLAGCDAYLVEPVGEAALLQVLRDLHVLPEQETSAQQRQRLRKMAKSGGRGTLEGG